MKVEHKTMYRIDVKTIEVVTALVFEDGGVYTLDVIADQWRRDLPSTLFDTPDLAFAALERRYAARLAHAKADFYGKELS